MIIDWDLMEAEVEGLDQRVPPIGATYRLGRACPHQLGQMWCVKVHDVDRDPVHVCAHKDYGVIAVWSHEGGPPQINQRLYERVGVLGMCYLFGSLEPGTIVLVTPKENA
jgi:hypothetical protein